MKTLEEAKAAILEAETEKDINAIAKEIRETKIALVEVGSNIWIDPEINKAYAYGLNEPLDTNTLEGEAAAGAEEYINTLESKE